MIPEKPTPPPLQMRRDGGPGCAVVIVAIIAAVWLLTGCSDSRRQVSYHDCETAQGEVGVIKFYEAPFGSKGYHWTECLPCSKATDPTDRFICFGEKP